MRNLMFLAFIFSILISTLLFNGKNINALENTESILIQSYEEDITGDGLKENIELKGTLLSQDSNYYHMIWAEITGKHSKKWKINYGGGYEPELKFIDINNDNVQNIIFHSSTNDQKYYHNQTHTLKNGQIKKVTLPKQHYVTGNFKDNFIIDLTINPHDSPVIIDVKNRSQKYIHQNIYDKTGKLLKKVSIITKPISIYKPIFIDQNNGFGLKSYQHISGTNHDDELGVIETLWYFENDQWVILHTKWISS